VFSRVDVIIQVHVSLYSNLTLKATMKTKTFYSIVVFLILLTSSAFAQQPQPSTAAPSTNSASKGTPGTISDDKKTYTTNDGRTVTIGQTIYLGKASNTTDNLFMNCKTGAIRAFGKWNTSTDAGHLEGDYAGRPVVIKDIAEKNGAIYLYFKKPGVATIGTIEAGIEAGLSSGELVIK
jgi:hypothetical protein